MFWDNWRKLQNMACLLVNFVGFKNGIIDFSWLWRISWYWIYSPTLTNYKTWTVCRHWAITNKRLWFFRERKHKSWAPYSPQTTTYENRSELGAGKAVRIWVVGEQRRREKQRRNIKSYKRNSDEVLANSQIVYEQKQDYKRPSIKKLLRGWKLKRKFYRLYSTQGMLAFRYSLQGKTLVNILPIQWRAQRTTPWE